jgi:predicted ATPase/DNA-binding SARP family transcriptional activator
MLQFGVLGPVEVVGPAGPVEILGARRRSLLARLLVSSNEVVSTDRLVEDLWGGDAPRTAVKALQMHVSFLRRAFASAGQPPGDETLRTRSAGYALVVGRGVLDSDRFEHAISEGRRALAAAQFEVASRIFRDAAEIWRGPAFADVVGSPFAQPQIARLEELRLAAEEDRFDAELGMGGHHRIVPDIEGYVKEQPLRERAWSQLMMALYRCGRQVDALRCYERARSTLADSGLSPSRRLREVEQLILAQSSVLDWQATGTAGIPDPVGPGQSRTKSDIPSPTTPDGIVVSPTTSGADYPLAQVLSPLGDANGRQTLQGSASQPLTSFVGRATELGMVTHLVRAHRLVTLTGTGGCGKTRLALVAARSLTGAFPDGAWFVDLTSVPTGGSVAASVAATLNLSVGDERALETLREHLSAAAALIVLDNCEHVALAAAELVSWLLAHCADLHIVVTSREELLVPTEQVWRVPSLTVPTPGAAYDEIRSSEAVQLFLHRTDLSALGELGLEATAGLEAVSRICQRLDGIPLAIELAAALVPSLSVEEVAERLDQRFALLTTGSRLAVPRQRTLAAAVDWSFNLLTAEGRDLFVTLGVFVGPFPLAAVEAVSDDHQSQTVGPLAELVRKSMVSVVRVGDGRRTSYRLLESLRQYARELLDGRTDAQILRERHANYYASFAEEAEQHVHGSRASEWLARVVYELPNLREALAWSFSADDLATGLRLAGALAWYLGRIGRIGEASEWIDLALEHDEQLTPPLRLLARTASGTLAFCRGDYSQTGRLGDEGIALARELGDRRQLTISLIVRGGTAVYAGAFDRAEACFHEAEDLCNDLGDQWGRAWLLTLWSVAFRHRGDLVTAHDQLIEAVGVFEAIGDQHGQILPLVNLAINELLANRTDDAGRHATKALVLAQQLGDRQNIHVACCVLGRVELERHNLSLARQLLLSGLADFPGHEHMLVVAWSLEALARLSALLGQLDAACVLVGFAERLRADHGIAPAWDVNLRLPAEFSERAEQARTRGATLTLAEVVSGAALATVAALVREGTA